MFSFFSNLKNTLLKGLNISLSGENKPVIKSTLNTNQDSDKKASQESKDKFNGINFNFFKTLFF